MKDFLSDLPQFLLIALVVILLVGIGPALVVAGVLAGDQVTQSAETTGVITSSLCNTQDVCSVRVRFETKHKLVVFYDSVEAGTKSTGDRVTVHYDPSNPSDASLNTSISIGSILIVIGVILTIIASIPILITLLGNLF
jgi:hypothetical protein